MAEEEKKGSELAKVEPEVKVLSPVEKAEGDKRFEAKITQLLIEEKDVTKAVLYHHWRKGEFITELRSNPEKWGNHTIDDLFTRFNAGKTTINAWQNFYLKYEDKNKLQELADSGATWRDVYNVLTIADDKQREDLLQKRITNTIDSVKLAKQVKKINAAARGKKPKAKAKNTKDTVTQRSAQSALNTVRSSNEVLLTAISSMDEFREAYDEFQKMEEGKLKSDIQASLQDNFRNISILNKKLVWILEYRDKLLAKRKAAAEAAKKS